MEIDQIIVSSRNHYFNIRATSGINNNSAQIKIRREKRKRLKRKRWQMN